MSYLPTTSIGRALSTAATAGDGRTTLALGTIATQDSDDVTITGGTISGITLIGLEDVVVLNANTTLATTDKVVLVDSGAAPRIITLPPATSSGRCYIIKRGVGGQGGNNVTVTADTSGDPDDTIDGAANFVLSTDGESITIVDVAPGAWSIV
jgi:hypothetical protein